MKQAGGEWGEQGRCYDKIGQSQRGGERRETARRRRRRRRCCRQNPLHIHQSHSRVEQQQKLRFSIRFGKSFELLLDQSRNSLIGFFVEFWQTNLPSALVSPTRVPVITAPFKRWGSLICTRHCLLCHAVPRDNNTVALMRTDVKFLFCFLLLSEEERVWTVEAFHILKVRSCVHKWGGGCVCFCYIYTHGEQTRRLVNQ